MNKNNPKPASTFEITYNVFGLCFCLTSFLDVFVKYPTGVKLGSPDKLLVVGQSVHPNNTSIILNVSKNLLPLALVEWVHKALDFCIVSHVKHSVFWSCQVREQKECFFY